MVPIKTFKNVLPNELIIPDMQTVAATRPLVTEIFSDCGRIKTGIPLKMWKNLNEWSVFDMLTVEILQSMYKKGLNQLDFLWFFKLCCIQPVFLRIKDVASNTLLRTFLKIKILSAEGFKLSACLPPYPTHYCIFRRKRGIISKGGLGFRNFRYDFWWVGGDVWRWLCRHVCQQIDWGPS